MVNTNGQAVNPVTWIGVDKLVLDPVINTRPMTPTRVAVLARDFDPDLVGVIHVSPRDRGTYAIIDGQHRVQAVREALGADQVVPCWIHKGIRTAKQASLFVGLNNSAKVPPLFQFMGRVNANQPIAVAIAGIIEDAGLKLTAAAGDGKIRCVASLERVYAGSGDPVAGARALRLALKVVTEAWGKTASAVSGSIVEGVGLMILRYGDQVEIDSLISKLASSKGGAQALLGQARALKDWRGGTVSRAVAGSVVNVYNRGRRVGALADWWA